MKEKLKKKKGIARLFEIAGERKGLLILAGILSAGSATCMLVPYWSVYRVLQELLLHASDLEKIDTDILGMVCLLWTDRRIIATLCGTDGLTCSSFPYPIRITYQAIGTHRTLIVRISERYIYRKHQENYGTECRKD